MAAFSLAPRSISPAPDGGWAWLLEASQRHLLPHLASRLWPKRRRVNHKPSFVYTPRGNQLIKGQMEFENEGFMKLANLYRLPGQMVIAKEEFRIKPFWLPEVGQNVDSATHALIHQEGRLVAKIVAPELEGADEVSVTTLWFDGKPFAVLHQQGYDNRKRWVTDVGLLYQAAAYVLQKVSELLDVAEGSRMMASEDELPVEELFGYAFAKRMGFNVPEIGTQGVMLLSGPRVLPGIAAGCNVVIAKTPNPPALLRRGNVYHLLDHVVTAEEHARNPALVGTEEEDKGGYKFAFVYKELSAPPQNYRDAMPF
jgi:hypothetical protein